MSAGGWGIVLDALGNLGEGISGVIGSNQAASTEQAAINNAQTTLQPYYTQAQTYQQPYFNAGTQQLNNLNNGINNGAFTDKEQFNYQQSPDYQFQMQQGQQGLQQQSAAAGGLFSGATMKALQKYGQNVAYSNYQNAFNNYNTNRVFNQTNLNNQALRMQNVAQMGQNAGQNLSNLQMEQGNQMAGLQLARGNVNAARVMANTGNTQGVFNSIAQVGQSMMGADMGSITGNGGSGNVGGGNAGYSSGGQGGTSLGMLSIPSGAQQYMNQANGSLGSNSGSIQ